jgi:hypothetical protein
VFPIDTSFPQSWTRNDDTHEYGEDLMSFLNSIYKSLSPVERPQIESVYDLAYLIVLMRLATFGREKTSYDPAEIMDMYERTMVYVVNHPCFDDQV